MTAGCTPATWAGFPAAVAVVGLPDPGFGEIVGAVVQLRKIA
jgi:hypothetical protein